MTALKLRLVGIAFILLSLVGLHARNAQANDCPRRHFNGVCIQVITFARHPGTGQCCTYPNPCVVPPGFQIDPTCGTPI